MWFSNVYLKTLRDFRIAIAGWGLGIGALMYTVLAAISSVAGTAAARASLASLAASFSWIAEPIQVTTPGGYATWKYGFTILVVVIWPLLVGSRMLRGEEERGSLDALLALPRSRGSVALAKLAALWTALAGIGLLVALLTAAGGATAHADFGLGGALLFGLDLALICAVFGGVALLASQFTLRAGAAAGFTGGLLALAIVVDMVHRVIPHADWFSRLSPVYYYNLSKPLIPSYGVNIGALAVLLLLTALLNGAALWLFVRRDIGGTVRLAGRLRPATRVASPARALPVNAWSLRSVYARGLAMVAAPTAWWTLVIAGLAAWMVFIVQQTEQQLRTLYQSSPGLANLIGTVGGSDALTNDTLLSFFFIFLPLLLMAFAVTQTNRWAADEEEGRLELTLATPQPRLVVVLARFGALATATALIGIITMLATLLASTVSGLRLDTGHLAAAALGMIPIGLLVAALGYLFAGWLRTAVETGLLSFLLVIWFFITFLGPDLSWPSGVLRLSPLYYYGAPLLNGLSIGNILTLVAAGVVALALAAARFVRKDIGR